MYFNNSKEDTNIDSEFEDKRLFNFSKFKIPLIIIGIIILLIVIIIIISNGNKTKYFIDLKEQSEMTIYQGTTYEEPGYIAYDDKKNDLTAQVSKSGNVDSNTIGTYIITYSLHGTKITRTVKVIAKPEAITYIYLKGDKNTHLKVGEKYTEQGCIANDTIDGDITKKVTISGKVDTDKKGIYEIKYTVTNSKGKTTTETRTVIVE